MKTKLLVILCVMVFAGAIMVGPVAGDSAISVISGNITGQYISITEAGTIANWVFVQGGNSNTTDITLGVTCNVPGWTVKAYDNLDVPSGGSGAKPLTTRGRMAQANSLAPGNYEQGANKPNLSSPLEIAGTSSPLGNYTAIGLDKLPTDSAGTLRLPVYQGASDYLGAGIFTSMPIRIDQPISYIDPVLANGQVYKIIVTFEALIP
jgi:hypothetical protein